MERDKSKYINIRYSPLTTGTEQNPLLAASAFLFFLGIGIITTLIRVETLGRILGEKGWSKTAIGYFVNSINSSKKTGSKNLYHR